MAKTLDEVKQGFGDKQGLLTFVVDDRDGAVVATPIKHLGDEFTPILEKAKRMGGQFNWTAKKFVVPLEKTPVPPPRMAEHLGSSSSSPKPSPTDDSASRTLQGDGFAKLKLSLLIPSPFQPRVRDERYEEFLKTQVESIRKHHQISEILVSPAPSGNYIIVDGHTTVEALRILDIETADCTIRKLSEQEMMDFAWERNNQRRDWTDYEKARFLNEYAERWNLKQVEVSKRTGLSEGRIAQLFAMVKAEQSQKFTAVNLQKLNEWQFRKIMELPEDKRGEVLKKIEEGADIPKLLNEIETPSKEPELKPIPCESCQNNVDNGGDCHRVHFTAANDGGYVCQYQNKPLPVAQAPTTPTPVTPSPVTPNPEELFALGNVLVPLKKVVRLQAMTSSPNVSPKEVYWRIDYQNDFGTTTSTQISEEMGLELEKKGIHVERSQQPYGVRPTPIPDGDNLKECASCCKRKAPSPKTYNGQPICQECADALDTGTYPGGAIYPTMWREEHPSALLSPLERRLEEEAARVAKGETEPVHTLDEPTEAELKSAWWGRFNDVLPPTLVDKVDEYEPEASKDRKILYTRSLIESMLEILLKHEILDEAVGVTMRKMEVEDAKEASGN